MPQAVSRDPLAAFHPLVGRWFRDTLGEPTPPQRDGWPAIASGQDTLILAPTGTGKTFAAFLWELNALILDGQNAPLPNAVHILYISPLKALSNDIERNLLRPLGELRERFHAAKEHFPDIRVAVRTGDTSPSARQRMIRRTPQILITTPESLNILLTTTRGRSIFPEVRAVIVDEIHALAGTKRGSHLALTLERLDALRPLRPQRIGLSATQRPLDEIARYLGGCETPSSNAADSSPRFRPVTIIDCGTTKAMELAVRSPVPDLGRVGGSVWPAVVDLSLGLIRSFRTTLVFVNNRAQAEKIAARINAAANAQSTGSDDASKEELARPYHGSLSRERRLALEQALKAGQLPALVTTSSLELGIDIGSVDLVIQLQSPKRVAAGLQRVGRAGHSVGDPSRGIIVPTFRDDLLECVAIVSAMAAGEVEPTRVPQNALDVLAQSIVAIASVENTTADSLFALVRRAYPYHRLTRTAFDETLAMLAGKYPSDLAAELEARVSWDRATGTVSGLRGSRLTAIISGGTIPDRGLYTVNLPDRTRLGELDEEFVHESRVGDVFQLGSATWRIAVIERDRVIVTPAPGSPARMPFWHGEFLSRSIELSQRVGALRRELAALPPDSDGDTVVDDERLAAHYRCDAASVGTMRRYVSEQRAATGIVPDDRTLVVEHFRDALSAVRIVVHSPFGGRVNAPWGMALARRARGLLGDHVDVQLQTTDDGIMLRLPDLADTPPVRALMDLSAAEADLLVREEIGGTPLFGARFRMNAARALLLPRGTPTRRMPRWLQRLKAADLLEAVRQFPSFPIVVETYREVLQDAFDMDALAATLRSVHEGRIAVHIVGTDRPSPFASGLQFGFVMDWLYADDTPRAERSAALLTLDQQLLDEVMGSSGLSPEIAQALETLVTERQHNIPMEDAELTAAAGQGDRAARREIFARYFRAVGVVTIPGIGARYGWPAEWVEERLLEWQRAGRIVRGATKDGDPQWYLRRIIEAARRKALVAMRAAIEPADLATFAAFLQRWQHVDPRDRLSGEAGLAAVLEQLEGTARPAEGWERDYFPARLSQYDPQSLARLATTGAVVWAGGARKDGASDAPLLLATVRLFRRGEGAMWMPAGPRDIALTDRAVAVRDALVRSGALFVADIATLTGLGPLAVRDALRELVAAGLVTNDTIEALREVIRTRALPARRWRREPDPTRWLPETFTPSPGRKTYSRPVSPQRLPKWQRPDRPSGSVPAGWIGRWSLLAATGTLGERPNEEDHAAAIARTWFTRYGVVTRDWWARERPPVEWRMIYRELKRMEYRGEVRRGYFVAGLSGAQFAHPEAVERLRAIRDDSDPPLIALASSDPANPYTLRLPAHVPDPITRPRGRGGILVTRRGTVLIAAEARGQRMTVAPALSPEEVDAAREALDAYLARTGAPSSPP